MPEDSVSVGIEKDKGQEIGRRTTELDYNLLKADYDVLKKELDALKIDYAAKCRYIDDGIRAALTPWMLANTKFTIEQLDKMETAEMERYRSTAALYKMPVASVGAMDEAYANSKLTAGDRFKFDHDTKPKLYEKGG